MSGDWERPFSDEPLPQPSRAAVKGLIAAAEDITIGDLVKILDQVIDEKEEV